MLTRALPVALGAVLLLGCPSSPPVTPPVPTASTGTPAEPPPSIHPPTEKRPVTDTYHGVSVVDDYRWLESSDDAAVKSWITAQSQHARAYLDGLAERAPIHARLSELLRAETVSYYAVAYSRPSKQLFALKHQPPKQQDFLVVLSSPDKPAEERVLLDPNELDKTAKTTIDWYRPSPDGKLVAVSLSSKGTESGDVSVFETATGKRVHEIVPRVNGGTAGGSLSWSHDGKGFFYTRYPRGQERPAADMSFFVQIYYHQLGTPTESDRYELGKDFPRIAEYELTAHHPSKRLLATVQKGDGGEFALHLRSADGTWKQLSDYGDKILQAAFGPKDKLYLLSRQGAPRGKVVRLSLADPDLSKAETVIGEAADTIVDSFWEAPSVRPTENRLYVLYQLGGPSEIRVFDLSGKQLAAPKQLPVGAAGGITPLEGDDILFEAWSFVTPSAWYRFEAKGSTTAKTKLITSSPVDLSAVKVVRELAVSKDGTKVPVNILLPAGAEPGRPGPCVVNGYGGYGVSVGPRFRPFYAALIEQGICYAVANLRGGGEFGETWHKQGMLTQKQNVFDDFAAVLQHLISRGYSSSDKLGILGGSNGGLLMGATLVQHPELVKAVVSLVGIYDMLRVELSPNGAFNVTEFGTVKNPDHFKALYAYSPYHNVKDGTPFPATLMITGENDPRVLPLQSRKMIARLQAASSSQAPLLLWTSADSGHGGGESLDDQIAKLTDAYAFFFRHLGVKPKQ